MAFELAQVNGGVPAGHRPSTDEAEDAVRHLRTHGPTPRAFAFRQPFPAPDRVERAVRYSVDPRCPA